MSKSDNLTKLNESFGSYRAEWLKGRIFELFAEPSYFTALQDNRPCIIEGGRGTGKTTVLRGLSYQGQFALHKNRIAEFDRSLFIGIYLRVNTNHVRSFIGSGLSDENWGKIFSHYFNLLICKDILVFLKWHKGFSPADQELSQHACELISLSLHLETVCDSLEALISKVDIEMYAFQSKINNIIDVKLPPLSMPGDPIKILTECIIELKQFNKKMFFILLDEYENFEDYQQRIVNSLIKHTTESYTFKVGVREMGWRVKHTMNHYELLHDPADYVLINIEQKLTEGESHFEEFARNVCHQRFSHVFLNSNENFFNIEDTLESFTIEQEAEVLEVSDTDYVQDFQKLSPQELALVNGLPKLYLYFIGYWANWHQLTLSGAINDYFNNKKEWNTRYENYKYDMLFKIRRGRGKRGIQKYYCGWLTYTKLANGNIRYLMELVYKAYERHFNSGSEGRLVSAKDQTQAAQEVGHKNLMELEGLWKNGAQLTKLLLGFGRVFQLLACTEGKSAPEKNQFTIDNSANTSEEVKEIISAAVMNLALVRSPGNKLNSQTSTRDYIYMIHPIYSAFFEFSHRKKRKILVKPEHIMGLINTPKKSIGTILAKSHLYNEESFSLPSQMSLFEAYYKDDK